MESNLHGAVPLALPFDDEGDAPVAFALTAAARRALDPAGVPALRVVPDRPVPDAAPALRMPAAAAAEVSDEPLDDIAPDDLRPAQARALRRSGMPVTTIAAAMGVDVALVGSWTEDVAQRHDARRRPGPQRAPGSGPGTAARRAVPTRASVPSAAAGMAVALARIDADGAAATLVGDRPELVGAALDAIRTALAVEDAAIRVSARTGPAEAADRLRGQLADALSLASDRIVVGRASTPEADGDAAIRVRISDQRVVTLLDAWAETLVAGREGLRAAN